MVHEYEARDGLYRISDNKTTALAHVVFVHGLEGGGHSTWTGNAGESGLGFWPAELAKDHPNCCLWTLHYTARLLERNPFARSRSIDLLDRASWMLQCLVQQKIHEKPIVFVAHSLGGVLVKQALQFAQSLGPPQWQDVWNRTQGVVFLATPHVGSQLANVAGVIATVVRGSGLLARLFLRPSPSLRNLEKNNPTLRYLSDWYRDHAPAKGIETRAFAEQRPCRGMMIVDPSSANPQIPNQPVIPLPDEDHISIAKPTSRQSLVYSGVSALLSDLERRLVSVLQSAVPAAEEIDKVTAAAQADNQRHKNRLLGYWWERVTVDEETTFSHFRIERDALFNSVYLGDGRSYNADGDLVATWNSVIARVHSHQGDIVLQYVWQGRHKTKGLRNVPFHGFGEISFTAPADISEPARTGQGRFWDVNEANYETTVKQIELQRISDGAVIRAIEKGLEHPMQSYVTEKYHKGRW